MSELIIQIYKSQAITRKRSSLSHLKSLEDICARSYFYVKITPGTKAVKTNVAGNGCHSSLENSNRKHIANWCFSHQAVSV